MCSLKSRSINLHSFNDKLCKVCSKVNQGLIRFLKPSSDEVHQVSIYLDIKKNMQLIYADVYDFFFFQTSLVTMLMETSNLK